MNRYSRKNHTKRGPFSDFKLGKWRGGKRKCCIKDAQANDEIDAITFKTINWWYGIHLNGAINQHRKKQSIKSLKLLIRNLQCFMNLSWDKLSNRCLRAMFSMPNIRFCWSRNSSSAETSYPSACKVRLADSVKSCTTENKQFLVEHFSFWRPCLQNLDISFHFSYILKFPESGPLGKLPAFYRTKDLNLNFFFFFVFKVEALKLLDFTKV